MSRFNDFREYLEQSWSQNTAYKYSRAIYTISNELFNYGLIEYDIYMIEDKQQINELLNRYLSIKELEEKDIRGNRMYSNAIKRYVEYFNSITLSKHINEETEEYITTFKDKPKTKPDASEVILKERIKRDSVVSGNAIVAAKYRCEYNVEHKFFESKTTGKNYVEAHHIIPMMAHEDFKNSLDVEANIASLCIVCHKVLHHGRVEDKIDILSKLYNDRKYRFSLCGISITFEELVNYYK